MSDEYLKDPLSLFSVKGKTAIVTGASGAFGAMAAKVLAGAGANVVISAGGADALEEGRAGMRASSAARSRPCRCGRRRKPIATGSSMPR